MRPVLAKSAIGIFVSLLLGTFVFGAAMLFTNPSYAFYAGLCVAVCGTMIVPLVIKEEGQGRDRK